MTSPPISSVAVQAPAQKVSVFIQITFLLNFLNVEPWINADLEEDGQLLQLLFLYAGCGLSRVEKIINNAEHLDQKSQEKDGVD